MSSGWNNNVNNNNPNARGTQPAGNPSSGKDTIQSSYPAHHHHGQQQGYPSNRQQQHQHYGRHHHQQPFSSSNNTGPRPPSMPQNQLGSVLTSTAPLPLVAPSIYGPGGVTGGPPMPAPHTALGGGGRGRGRGDGPVLAAGAPPPPPPPPGNPLHRGMHAQLIPPLPPLPPLPPPPQATAGMPPPMPPPMQMMHGHESRAGGVWQPPPPSVSRIDKTNISPALIPGRALASSSTPPTTRVLPLTPTEIAAARSFKASKKIVSPLLKRKVGPKGEENVVDVSTIGGYMDFYEANCREDLGRKKQRSHNANSTYSYSSSSFPPSSLLLDPSVLVCRRLVDPRIFKLIEEMRYPPNDARQVIGKILSLSQANTNMGQSCSGKPGTSASASANSGINKRKPSDIDQLINSNSINDNNFNDVHQQQQQMLSLSMVDDLLSSMLATSADEAASPVLLVSSCNSPLLAASPVLATSPVLAASPVPPHSPTLNASPVLAAEYDSSHSNCNSDHDNGESDTGVGVEDDDDLYGDLSSSGIAGGDDDLYGDLSGIGGGEDGDQDDDDGGDDDGLRDGDSDDGDGDHAAHGSSNAAVNVDSKKESSENNNKLVFGGGADVVDIHSRNSNSAVIAMSANSKGPSPPTTSAQCDLIGGSSSGHSISSGGGGGDGNSEIAATTANKSKNIQMSQPLPVVSALRTAIPCPFPRMLPYTIQDLSAARQLTISRARRGQGFASLFLSLLPQLVARTTTSDAESK